ncbi:MULTISPECIES: ABC transporter permease [unclassified Saccharothrix]|uniref:ABC transporter permease n=1 Tax=unclassified Saccharothrix TaxID=2593673 RepID=UPI00307E76F6
MFVAWRDLRFARGRFALMGAVVVLMTMLVTLLSGLTAGLARDSTSAVADLPVDHVVFGGDTFAESAIAPGVRDRWDRVPGVESVQALGISTAKATAGARTAVVSVFGVEPGGPVPSAPDGQALLSAGAAEELGVTAGQTVVVNGRSVEVAGVSGDASYSHLPVVWTGPTPDTTVLAITTDGAADLAAADRDLGTRTVTRADALSSIGSYTSENGSLQLMRGMLFAISALVIGAFFTVWTIQRGPDIAVLKALGATTGLLLRDALGQALVLLVAGTALGAGLAAALGAWAATAVPFVLDASLALPAVVMTVLGLLGAALAVRRITSVDPLTALGSTR